MWKSGGRTMDYAEFWNQSDEVKDLQWSAVAILTARKLA
jgi:hypothetical protein